MTFADIYLPEIWVRSKSVMGGEVTYTLTYDSPDMNIPILQAFLKDDDIQELRICSANMGFIRTYSKYYKDSESVNDIC